MLFVTVLYFCVFAVVTYQTAQTVGVQDGRRTVVIDPGHGGEDGGATGVGGAAEAALNLEISLRLRDMLRLGGIEPVLIRETDTAVYSEGCRTISEKKVSDIRNRTQTRQRYAGRAARQYPPEFLFRGKIPRRAGVLRKNGQQPAARGADAEEPFPISRPGQSPTAQDGGRRVSDGAYHMSGHPDRMWIFVQCGRGAAAAAAGLSEENGGGDCGDAIALAVRGAYE